MINVARRIELDAETLRTLLERRGDEKWRTMLGLMREPPPFFGSVVLPPSVTLTGTRPPRISATALRRRCTATGRPW